MANQTERAEGFRTLHDRRRVLVLPNAWDVPSARIFEGEGFPAVATSSAGMMVSLGYPDGETMPVTMFLSAIERIANVLSIPLSVDVVGGFGSTAKDAVAIAKSVVKAGAVGVNIEDFVHSTKELVPLDVQAEKISSLKELGESLGVPFVVNGRTDALRYAEGDEEAKFREAVRRGIAYRDAGADCVYPMGLVEPMQISDYVKAVDCPVNVMVRKGLPPVPELARLGVARVSFGPSASYAAMGLLKRASKEVIGKGTYETLTVDAIGFDELNSLALPKGHGKDSTP